MIRYFVQIKNTIHCLGDYAQGYTSAMPPSEVTELRRVFGSQVRRYRKACGLTHTQLAEQVSLSLDMIGRLERGSASPSLDTISALGEALAVSPAVLLGGSPFSKNESGDREQHLRQIFALLTDVGDTELQKIESVIAALVRN